MHDIAVGFVSTHSLYSTILWTTYFNELQTRVNTQFMQI